MALLDIARMVLALALTLGLIGLAAVAARRFMPGAILRLKPAAERRMQVLESLILDPSRRLVLVRVDKEERLILLGEGRVLQVRTDAQTAAPAVKTAQTPKAPVKRATRTSRHA